MADFEGIVTVNGVGLYVVKKGQGPRILVIHGGPDWDHTYLRAFTKPLERDAELLFFDLRGCGRSERVLAPSKLHVSEVAQDVRGLMEHFVDEPWTILGFSFGGRVGLEVLSRFPEKVERFVLASSSAYAGPAIDGLTSRLARLENEADVRNRVLSTIDQYVWRESAREEAIKVINRVRFSTEWLEAIRIGSSVSYPERDYSHILLERAIPLLVLHGEFDRQFDPEQAKRLGAQIPTARCAIIPKAGHFAHMDAPDAWNRAVAEFVTDGGS